MSVASLYTQADSAVTRMRKALVWNFEQVKVTNGYRNTLGTVLTEVVDPSQATVYTFPLLALVRGDTEIENEDQSEQLWHKRIRYLAMVFLREEADPTLARETLLQDLEQALGAGWDAEGGWMLRGEDGQPTCRIASLDGDKPFGMFMNRPQVGFAFRFSVRLAQDILDPSVAC
jgi:hypothetical protein